MEAVAVAVLIVLPILALALAIRYWIVRSPNPATRRRRRFAAILSLVAIFVIFDVTNPQGGRTSKLRRLITGASEIEIRNETAADLQDLEWTIIHADGQTNSATREKLSPRASRLISAPGPLTVQTFHGRAGTNYFSFTGAIPKRQSLLLRIHNSGQIKPEFD